MTPSNRINITNFSAKDILEHEIWKYLSEHSREKKNLLSLGDVEIVHYLSSGLPCQDVVYKDEKVVEIYRYYLYKKALKTENIYLFKNELLYKQISLNTHGQIIKILTLGSMDNWATNFDGNHDDAMITTFSHHKPMDQIIQVHNSVNKSSFKLDGDIPFPEKDSALKLVENCILLK